MKDLKFKERQPEKTVEIIKNYFNSLGFEIIEKIKGKSEVNTYFCSIGIYYNLQEVCSANGKGTNEIYSLASAYAEAYERFCNGREYYCNPFFISNTKNKIKNDEIELSFKEIFKDNIKDYYSNLIPEEKLREEYLKLICNNKFRGYPFKNIKNNEIKYYDFRLCQLIQGTTGMVAGNTLEEALNQGISEILERTTNNLFYSHKQEKYYILDLTEYNLSNELKNKINYLVKNYDFKLFDLSYNFNMPVLLGVLIDKNNYKIIPSFGSFPVFEIALERVITELFQGVNNYKNDNNNGRCLSFQCPFLQKHYYDHMIYHSGTYTNNILFPEFILFEKNCVKVKKPSSTFNNFNNNFEILEYYKNLLHRLNYELYYYNMSLINNMYSLFIFCDNFYPAQNKIDILFKQIKEKKINYKKIISHIFNTYKICNNILNNQLDSIQIEECYYDNIYEKIYHNELQWYLWFSPYYKNIDLNSYHIFYKKIKNNGITNELIKELINTNLYYNSRKFLLIKNYKQIYSDDKLFEIFNEMKLKISIEDIKNINNYNYLINNIFYKSIYEDYNTSVIKSLQGVLLNVS